MKKPTWHGLTFEQWKTLWDSSGWREEIRSMLYEIARDRRATVADRLAALQTVNQAMLGGILPDDPLYARNLLEILLDLSRSGSSIGWFGRRHARRQAERLQSARWMIHTAEQFNEDPGEGEIANQLGDRAPQFS